MYRGQHGRHPSGSSSINYAAAAPSPRVPDFGVDAPSPRRLTSFDCAPSPLPMDSRQRHAKYDYAGDSIASPPATAVSRVVGGAIGHRRSLSRTNSVASSAHRMAFYGQPGLAQRASHADSLLSIPISTRYSFERSGESRDVHGMF